MIEGKIEIRKHHDNGVLTTEMVYRDGVRIETRHFHSNGLLSMSFVSVQLGTSLTAEDDAGSL